MSRFQCLKREADWPLGVLQCAVENEELVQHLGAAKDAQRQLTAEVSGSASLLQARPASQPPPARLGVPTRFSSESKVVLTRKFVLTLSPPRGPGRLAPHSPLPPNVSISETTRCSPRKGAC